jgi:hypothetical protein
MPRAMTGNSSDESPSDNPNPKDHKPVLPRSFYIPVKTAASGITACHLVQIPQVLLWQFVTL